MKKAKNYQFVHIAYQGGVGFINNLISFFNNDYSDSELRKNLWVTRNRDIYEKYKDTCDIVYTDTNEVRMINKYGKLGQYIIVHGLHSSGFSLLLLNPNLFKRIIWRTWGHDINPPKPNEKSVLKTVYRYSSYFFYHRITKKFALIGTANIVDDLKVNEVYGNSVRCFHLPYAKPQNELKQTYKLLKELKPCTDGIIRVMIGHSGFPIDKHIEIIDNVMKFNSGDILFYIMLPYGDNDYIRKVEGHAREKLGEKCVIIKNRISYKDYLNFIQSMDIAILEMQNSSALGNIGLLLYYKKKIYLNPDGDVAKAFFNMRVPFGNANEIKNEKYTDFIDPFEYDEQSLEPFISYLIDISYCRKQWDELLHMLKLDDMGLMK